MTTRRYTTVTELMIVDLIAAQLVVALLLEAQRDQLLAAHLLGLI